MPALPTWSGDISARPTEHGRPLTVGTELCSVLLTAIPPRGFGQARRGAKLPVRQACHLEVLSVVCPMQFKAAMTEELSLDASKLSSLFGDALPVQWARQAGGFILR